MAVGIASGQANAILNAYARNVAYVQPAAFWVKLHLADPGAAGTTSPAANTTRQAATFSAAAAGAVTSSADINWTNVPNTETYSHVSFWDASSGLAVSDSVDGQFVVIVTRDGGVAFVGEPSLGYEHREVRAAKISRLLREHEALDHRRIGQRPSHAHPW